MLSYKSLCLAFLLLPVVGCGDPDYNELKLELNGEVIGTYEPSTGLVEFDAEQRIQDRMISAFDGAAVLSVQNQNYTITRTLEPIELATDLSQHDELTLSFAGDKTTVALVLESDESALVSGSEKTTTSSARGNLSRNETCQKHWFHGQKNRNKDCKWPWNCRGVYAASHPQHGDGISARCVCHL